MAPESDLTSRFAEIRRFFRIATPEKNIISEFLRDVELEMASHRTAINRLKTEIHALERRSERLKHNAEFCKLLLSPIHAIPPEILKMIFSFRCESNVLSRSSPPDALRLSMVCGRWRDIVFSTPRLWSSIEIDFGSWTKDFDVLSQLSQLFLKQSQTSPLRLSLTVANNSDETEGALPILRTIVEHCERWEHLSLMTKTQQFPRLATFDSVHGRLPLLKSLFLKPASYQSESNRPWECFVTCPALHILHVKPPPSRFHLPGQQLSLPWTQIKTLQLSPSYNYAAFPHLGLCTAVEYLRLERVGGGDHPGNYTSHVVHYGLRTLDIDRADDQSEVDGIFKHTTLPGLSSLKIWGHWDDLRPRKWPRWDNSCLEAFLERSFCTITSLQLQSLPITDTETLSLLGMIPTITSLYLGELRGHPQNRIVTRYFWDGLKVSRGSPSAVSIPLVPQLTDLKLVVHEEDLDADAFLNTLSSRWLPDPSHASELGIECLSRVVIVVVLKREDEQRAWKDGCLDCLECLRDTGMRISITYGSLGELYPEVSRVAS
ncbi:hypothetical protein PM082_009037 [Marasmius tenuissimus]|nr:hypothetical protein PM082_009037 [Marasmius tenuissimus]